MHYFFYFYVFLIPLEYIVEKIPKGPPGINYQMLTMLALFLWWVMGRPQQGKEPVLKNKLNFPLVAFLIYFLFGQMLASLTVSGVHTIFDPVGPTFRRFIYFFNSILVFWIAANMLNTRKQILYTLFAVIASSVMVYRAFRSDLSWVSAWHYSHDMRINGPFIYVGSNELAAYFLYGALMLLILAFAFQKWKLRGLFLVSGWLYAHGVMYSYSRGAQLAGIVALGVLAFLKYRLVLIIMIVLYMTMPMWLPVSVQDRWDMTTTDTGELEESAQSRFDFWDVAFDLYLRNPITGQGVGSFIHLNPYQMDAHSMYMRVLAEQGTIGIVLFAMIWIYILSMSVQLWRAGPTRFDRQYGLALFISTIGLMVANGFGDRFTHLGMIGHYWIFVGIGARLYAHMTGLEPLEDEVPAEGTQPQTSPAAAPSPLRLPVLKPISYSGWTRHLWLLKPLVHSHSKGQLEKLGQKREVKIRETPSPRILGQDRPAVAQRRPDELNLVGRNDRMRRPG